MTEYCDFIIIGGGIAGASAGYALAEHGSTTILEREDQPAYHSTGRSAAQFVELYGNHIIRSLVRLSKAFFLNPPVGFSDSEILLPRGALFIATETQRPQLRAFAEFAAEENVLVEELSRDEVCQLVPIMRPDAFQLGLHEPESTDMDVHALHGGFLRGLRARGGQIITDAEVIGLSRDLGIWTAVTRGGNTYQAPIVVNAAGAWADLVAKMAGVHPLGLIPKRRTAMLFDPPAGQNIETWPLVIDIDEQWYFKPDAGRVLVSPADETPVEPCDVQPEEIDIANAVDRIERMTSMKILRIDHQWSGLRTFAEDKTVVVGFAPDAEGFFWLAGQGGYGIETSPSLAAAAVSLIIDGGLPDRFSAFGLSPEDISPDRLLA